MIDVNKIDNNSLLVVPANIKNKLIKEISKGSLKNIKFLTKEQLKKKYYFDYTKETVYFLMQEYNLKYEVALVYLKNIYYIKDNFDNPKLRLLKEMKDKLDANGLLVYDKMFRASLKGWNISFYGYDYLDKYDNNLIRELESSSKVEVIAKVNCDYDQKIIYEFKTIEEEVVFIASRIRELLLQGVRLNQIKLANATGEYLGVIKKIFDLYKIPIVIVDSYLYYTRVGTYFIENLEQDVGKTLEKIRASFNLNDPEILKIYNRLIDIVNDYTWCSSYLDIKELLVNDLKKTSGETGKKLDSIELITLKDNLFGDDDYVFLVGFNQGSIPIIYKDEDFITDNLKENLDLDLTKDKNIREMEAMERVVRNIKNLVITYKLSDSAGSYTISSLNDRLNYKIEKSSKVDYNCSNMYNKIVLSRKIDNLIKYGQIEEDLDLLYANYRNLDYGKYDNAYGQIDSNSLREYLHNKLLLSYSSLDNYNRCNFRYYLANILKISIYEDTFMTTIGTLFHDILAKCFQEDFDYASEYDRRVKEFDKDFSIKEKFFLKKLKKELEFIIETMKKQYEYNSLTSSFYEQKIYINKDNGITFMGIIDKLMYKKLENDDKTLVAIIDYKTGNPNLNLNNVIYGIEMQLPIYLYLAFNSKLLEQVKIVGFYLQKILHNEIRRDNKKTYEELKKDNLKLQGYSTNVESILKEFDSSYNDSKVIKGMKTTTKGFSHYTKVLTDSQIEKLVEIVDKKLEESGQEILQASFQINPKRIDKKNLGCEFCKFKDICYRSEKDIVDLKEYKNLEFLEDE